MRTYRVEVDPSARADIDELTSWLQARMTLEGAEDDTVVLDRIRPARLITK